MDLNKVLQNSELTLTQQFKLISDKQLLSEASKEQLIELYLIVLQQLMLKENIVRELLKETV
jgi:hypothetical protein